MLVLLSGASITLSLGIVGVVLRSRVVSAVAASVQVERAVGKRDMPGACAGIDRAARAWKESATISAPLAPLLRSLGDLPQFGGDLRIAPDAIDLAVHMSAAGSIACATLPIDALNEPSTNRVAVIAQALGDHPDALPAIQSHLIAAEAAWQRAAPSLDHAVHLRPYTAQLRQVGDRLATATRLLDQTAAGASRAPWLLGLNQPRRFLVLLQNPFELRPTGGFIGVVCTVQVAEAHITLEMCRPSESFDTPIEALMPVPYTRYLRLGGYYLRDANWTPDFPTSARLIEELWARNGQPPIDGVVAVDPYAIVPLLEATGPVKLADGASIDADHAVESMLARYYDGAQYRDKTQFSDLLAALLSRVQTADQTTMLRLGAAIAGAVEERHILITAHDSGVADALARSGWDAAISPSDGAVLRIVDADVGYGAVNAFVERLTHYDLSLADDSTLITATVTLTYTNHYSAWAEAPTIWSVNGHCAAPGTLEVERTQGCYANYLRVLVPQGSRLIAIEGVDESLGTDQQNGRTIFGGYLRVDPGEQRIVRLHYRLPSGLSPKVRVEKQPGTTALPTLVTAHMSDRSAALWTSLRTDQTILIQTQPDLVIAGEDEPTTRAAFDRSAALSSGWQQWVAGRRDVALSKWQAGNAVDCAIDRAAALAKTDPGAATELLEALATVDTSGRAAFERGVLGEAHGEATAADAWYAQAARHNPVNPLAVLTLARRQVERSEQLTALGSIDRHISALRRWRLAIDALEQSGDHHTASVYLRVLAGVLPDDRELALRSADQSLLAGDQASALAQYTALAPTDDLWGVLGDARRAQMTGDRDTAIARYAAAQALASTQPIMFRIGDGLRDLGDTKAARQAYERAFALDPRSIWPLMAAGNMLRASDPDAAERLYHRAQQFAPASGYPDYALGTLLLDRGATAESIPLLESASKKQPDVQLFQDALLRAQAELHASASH